jgi:hypothetical protein
MIVVVEVVHSGGLDFLSSHHHHHSWIIILFYCKYEMLMGMMWERRFIIMCVYRWMDGLKEVWDEMCVWLLV